MTDKLMTPGHTWTQDATEYDGHHSKYLDTHEHRTPRVLTDKLMTPRNTWTQDAKGFDGQAHITWTHMDTRRHGV
jgi:hypothetical protein